MLRVLCHGGDRSDWGPVVSVLARRQDLDVARSTRLGAFYWAAGLMPWVYFVFQINGRIPPRRWMKSIYVVLFFRLVSGSNCRRHFSR